MITTPADFPWWRTKEGLHAVHLFTFVMLILGLHPAYSAAMFLPDTTKLRYRYCVFSGGRFDRWEDNGKLKRSLEGYKYKNYLKQTEDKLGKIQFQHAELSPARLTVSESHSNKAKMYAEWSRSCHPDNLVNPSDIAIIISYFLPVTLKKLPGGQWTADWDRENLLSLQIGVKMLWIGTVRYQNAPIPSEEEEEVTRVLNAMSCHPIYLTQSMHFQFYDVFCKRNLWPIMHHITDVYGPLNLNDISARGQQSIWFVYSEVHKLFRDKILELFHSGNLIWIHGFHLMLLPSFLRRRLPQEKIGYFFHTPFPSSEIWRSMSRREDLLRGILGTNYAMISRVMSCHVIVCLAPHSLHLAAASYYTAADQIGFHLYEYARHFLTVCQRLLGCNYEGNMTGKMILNVDGRRVALTCMHVGVDLLHVNEILEGKSFNVQMRKWKEKFDGKIIVAGE